MQTCPCVSVESKKEEKERAFYTILDTARFVMLLVLKKLQKMMGLGWSLSLSLSLLHKDRGLRENHLNYA